MPGRLAEVALRDSVVITCRKELHRNYPDIFPTEEAARREVKTLKENTDLRWTLSNKVYIYMGIVHLIQTIAYRVEGQRGSPRTVIVPNGFDTDLLDRLSTLHGGKIIKLVEPEPSDSAEPSATAQPEPEPTVEPSATVEPAPAPSPPPSLESVPEPEPSPEPSDSPIVDWTKIKLTCVWKWDGRMITKCSKPDIYDHPNGKVAGCRNCGAIHQEHAATAL